MMCNRRACHFCDRRHWESNPGRLGVSQRFNLLSQRVNSPAQPIKAGYIPTKGSDPITLPPPQESSYHYDSNQL